MMLSQLDEAAKRLLERVHVNMPWKYLPRHREMIFEHHLNVELGFEAEQLDGVTRSEFRAFAEQLQKAGCRVTLHGPFWDLSPGSVDLLIRQVTRLRLQQFFDLLSLFQPVQVVCHTGYDPSHHQGYREAYLERSLNLWEPLVKQAEKLRVPLLLENVWEYDPEFHREIFEKLPSPWFGFCLDVGHQHSFSKTSLAVWLETLVKPLMELHLHDNDGSYDHHLPVGQGTIDFAFLFEFLQSRGKSPLLTLEPHKKPHLFESLAGLSQVLPSSFPTAG